MHLYTTKAVFCFNALNERGEKKNIKLNLWRMDCDFLLQNMTLY